MLRSFVVLDSGWSAHFVGCLVLDTSQAMRPVSHPSVVKVGSAPLDSLKAKVLTFGVVALLPAPFGDIPRDLFVLGEKLKN